MRLCNAFLRLLARHVENATLVDDLTEEYWQIREEQGLVRALIWHWLQIVRIVPVLMYHSFYWSLTMFKNYIKTAIRAISRNRAFSFINMAGLSVGMACAMLILMWVRHELSYDRFHEKGDRLYKVIQHIQFNSTAHWAITQGPLGPALKASCPEIEDQIRVEEAWLGFSVGDEDFEESGAFVDPSFFEHFSFKLIDGDAATLFDRPDAIVLTRSQAVKFFGDKNALGQTLTINRNYDFTVTGIIEDFPDNSHLAFNYLTTMDLALKLGVSVENWRNSTFNTYVLLAPGISREQVVAKIETFLDDKPTLEEHARLDLLPLKDIHFTTDMDFDQYGTGNFQYVIIFAGAALFILVIACINFMNLSTALSTLRSKEVSLRKVIGARRLQVTAQFLGESVTLTLLAFALALLVVALALPAFNTISGKHFTLGGFLDLSMLTGMALLLLLTAVMAGLYPAVLVSGFSPSMVLRGSAAISGRGRLRKALVVFQFLLSVILLSGTFTVYRQIQYMQTRSLGYDKDNLLIVNMSRSKYEPFRQAMADHPAILDITGVESLPTYGVVFSNSLWHWEGQDPAQETLIRVNYIDYDFFRTMGIGLAQGREFSRKMASDSAAVIINEAALKVMGLEKPLESILDYDHRYKLSIVGVAKDFNFRSLHTSIDPLICILNPVNRHVVMRLAPGQRREAMEYVQAQYERLIPDRDFTWSFLDERLGHLYKVEEAIGSILKIFTAIAVLVACMGLFGLASFMALRRNKEIGVRKVLGAGTGGLVLLLVREFSKWVILANVLAWPLTWLLTNRWLENFAYRTSFSPLLFLITGLLTLTVALLTVGMQAVKAALANPVDAIRCD